MTASPPQSPPRDVLVFFALACAITWGLDFPLVQAWRSHEAPEPWRMLLAGLGAWGPTLAAFLVARRTGALREVFGRWRAPVGWVLVALFAPLALHQLANVLVALLGEPPSQWFYLPVRPEHVAALVMFSLGEEFGWRGFAHPRLADRYGPLAAALAVGAAWAVWHFAMWFPPDGSLPDPLKVAWMGGELVLWAVVIAWLFERTGRGMWIAIAFHAGGHLDSVHRAPEGEVRLRITYFVLVAVAAAIAGVALVRAGRESRRAQ